MRPIEQWILERFNEVVAYRETMHEYQRLMSDFLKRNPFSALYCDMGLGKTVSSATAVTDLLRDFELDGKVLIIGPKRVATTTWPDEFKKWAHLAEFNVELLYVADSDPRVKAARQRARAFAKSMGASPSEVEKAVRRTETAEKERIRCRLARSSATIHIIPRDWVEWLCEFWKAKWPYRTVIIDESSSFKDYKCGRYKALAKIRNTPGLITRLHELTATPASETYEHLFPQIFLMDRGQRLGKNITAYRQRYFTQNRYSFKWELRPGAEEEILQKISDICLVMKVEDYLDVKEPVFVPRYVEMEEGEMALYQQMERDMLITLDDGTEIEAETAAALSQKLLQMASGVVYNTTLVESDYDEGLLKKQRKIHHIHDHKIEALRDIVEEAQGQPLLVAYHHKSSLARLKKEFPKAVVMDTDGKCVKSWNAGKIEMLLVHPQSAGHGLNLQHGGHHLVFFDLPWSLENYVQTIGRLARQGQKHVVVVQILLCKGTLDEAVYAALCRKEDAQDMLFKILKRHIAKRRQANTEEL